MISRIEITRKLEFDAGHRIPNHKSKCRAIHGHRYVLECTISAPVVSEHGASDEGMIMDFSDLKTIMNEVIVDRWDHAFLYFAGDEEIAKLLPQFGKVDDCPTLPGYRTIRLDFIPTVENLAAYAFMYLSEALHKRNMPLVRLRLYETPNCWADVYAE